MGFAIEDGLSGKTVKVTDENELVTRSIIEAEIEHASSLGNAWIFASGERDIDATDTMLFVKNTGNTPMICDRLTVSPSNVACLWTLAIGTATTTPVGSAALTINLNSQFVGAIPEATVLWDETAVTDGTTINTIWTPIETLGTGALVTQILTGLVISKGGWLQVNQETESTSGSVNLWCHFAEIA